MSVLHEDADLLVVRKPAGLVCHPTKGDAWSSLIGRVRLHLRTEAEPQMVHRLDRETGGVMVFGKTTEASLELRRLWQAGLVTKSYVAVVHGWPSRPAGWVDAPLGRDTGSRLAIKDTVRPDGSPARTRYRVLSRIDRPEGRFAVVRVWLDTGRKHQIRIHLAHLGHPIVGDKIYGGDEELYLAFVERRQAAEHRQRLLLPCHALHADALWFPWGGGEQEFRCPPEGWLTDFACGLPVAWFEDPYDPARPGPGPAEAPGSVQRDAKKWQSDGSTP